MGTLGPLHADALRYDLARLRELVETLEPDLLGIEIDPEHWERGDLATWPLEVQRALAPAAGRTDTVVVPLGGPSPLELTPPNNGRLVPVRSALASTADRILIGLQRAVDGPEAASGAVFGHLCGLACGMKAVAASDAGRAAWARTNDNILGRLVEAVRRDPGRRVLVAVRCHRIHWLRGRLRAYADEIELVSFSGIAAARPSGGPAGAAGPSVPGKEIA